MGTCTPNCSTVHYYMCLNLLNIWILFCSHSWVKAQRYKTNLQFLSHPTDERAQKLAMATFWRTFHHAGRFSPAWWGGGVHALSLSLYLPSRAKLWYAPAERAETSPISPLPFYPLCRTPIKSTVVGLSYRHARLHRLAGRYGKPMLESTLSPSQVLWIWLQVIFQTAYLRSYGPETFASH